MTNNIKIMFNGREIELPFNIEELFSQLGSQEGIPSPHPFFSKSTPLFTEQKPVIPTQQIRRKIAMCKDVPARNVIISLNKRIIKLESLLKVKASTELEESLKTPFIKKDILTKKKIISKTKRTPKIKGKSKVKPKAKEKSRMTKKKIGKKK